MKCPPPLSTEHVFSLARSAGREPVLGERSAASARRAQRHPGGPEGGAEASHGLPGPPGHLTATLRLPVLLHQRFAVQRPHGER